VKKTILDFIHRDDARFSSELHRQAKRCLLDLLGVAAGASLSESSQILGRHVAAQYGPTESSRSKLLFKDIHVSECGAAMYGAGLIDALDAHDGQVLTKGHVGVTVLPVLLAQKNVGRLSGKSFLNALIVGYEIGTRAGIALHETVSDYHTSGAWNAIAGAAVAARVQGLNHEQTFESLGIAEYYGPRSQMMRCIDFPTMVKDGSTWGGLAGASAAVLAADGFTGAPAVTLFDQDVEDIWSDLGNRWYLHEQYFKAYPVCRWAQPAVECIRQLQSQHTISASDVARVEITSFHEARRLATKVPNSSDQAQYSTPFAVACTLRDGLITAEAITRDIRDPLLLSLSQRVEILESETYNDKFPAERWAHATIELKSGERLASKPTIARGNPENPLTDAEIVDKFFNLSASSLTRDQSRRIHDTVIKLESLASVQTLLDCL